MFGAVGLFASAAVFFGGGLLLVQGSDVNWGKKVNCFVVDETVVCPGCNYRAGLSCPRKLKNSQNCLEISTLPKTISSTSPPVTTYEEINFTETTQLNYNSSVPEAKDIQKEPRKNPIDMAIYLYHILGSQLPSYRFKRELEQTEEDEEPEICNWNGDCPCPLICCKTGPGCPKRCVMGIRLPPPWG